MSDRDRHAGPGAWREHAERRLREAGYRRGEAREAVVSVLDGAACGLSAAEIEDRLRTGGRRAGRASVYRALEQLEALELVQRLDLGHDESRYERIEPDGEHHHHLVCERCGRVAPFQDPSLERAVSHISTERGFHVTGHEVVLRGACASCR